MQRGSLQTYYEALDTTIKPKSGPQIRSDKKSSRMVQRPVDKEITE